MIQAGFGWAIANGAVAEALMRRLRCLLNDLRLMQVTNALEPQPEAETPDKAKQLEAANQNVPSSRKTILMLALFALILNGGAAIYTLPSFEIAMPDFNGMVA